MLRVSLSTLPKTLGTTVFKHIQPNLLYFYFIFITYYKRYTTITCIT